VKSYFQKEKLELQKLQESKFQELIKFQQDYLQQNRNNSHKPSLSKEFSVSVGQKQDTVMATLDSCIKREAIWSIAYS